MVLVLAWLGICVVLAVLLRRRCDLGAVAALTVWVLLPGVAGGRITGALPDVLRFHPASWLALVVLGVAAVVDPRAVGDVVARHILLCTVASSSAVAFLLITWLGAERTSVVLVVDAVVVPLVLFVLLLVGLDRRPDRSTGVRRWILALALLQCLVAVAQYLRSAPLVFGRDFAEQRWFLAETWTRWMGTTDHPLTLALLIGVAVPLTAGLRVVPRVTALSLLAIGMVITQSRTGLVVFALGVVLLILRSRLRVAGRVALTATAGVAALTLLASPLAAGVQGRLADDTGSTVARGDAWGWFLDHLGDFLAVGDGITASYRVAENAGLETSFESSIVMYAIGLGLLPALVWFGLQAWIVVRHAVVDPWGPLTAAGCVVLIVPQTFSGLVASTLAAPLVWVVLALCLARVDQDRVDRSLSGPPPGRRALPAGLSVG